jgi:hypothetical protein
MDTIREQWQGLARRYMPARREERREIWREVFALAPHLAEPDATGTFYGLVAGLNRGDHEQVAETLGRLTGTAVA